MRDTFGFADLTSQRRKILEWLLPVSLATTNAVAVATALLDELRRRRIIVPGSSIVERLVAAALVLAERHVANQLTGSLSQAQCEALDAMLAPQQGTAMSVLAWARMPPGAPGHKALKRLAEQLACLRAAGLDPARADGVHPERLRKLAREGARFAAQHLRMLSPLRRRATLVATILDATVHLTDDGVALFDRAVGRMFRRAEVREENAVLRDARAVKSPLFRSAAGRTDMLTDKPMNRVDAWRMIQRRAADLGMRIKVGCHTFRATGITAYLEAGGTLENAQAMAAHESPRTTKLYDRTGDEITLDEVERITI